MQTLRYSQSIKDSRRLRQHITCIPNGARSEALKRVCVIYRAHGKVRAQTDVHCVIRRIGLDEERIQRIMRLTRNILDQGCVVPIDFLPKPPERSWIVSFEILQQADETRTLRRNAQVSSLRAQQPQARSGSDEASRHQHELSLATIRALH